MSKKKFGYTINDLLLYSQNISNPIDLSGLYSNIKVNINLFASSISGEITISDFAGYAELIPLIGEEFLYLDVEPDELNYVTQERLKGWYRIYKISDFMSAGPQKGKIYTLYFVSAEYFIDRSLKVMKTYTANKLSNTAKSIYEDFIKKNMVDPYQRDIDVESTFLDKDIIIPNWSPFKAINYLAQESISESINTGGATYTFYETPQKFHFKSIETLTNQPPIRDYYYTPKQVVQTFGENITDAAQEIEEYRIISSFDVLENVSEGMYSSTLIALDVERHKMQKHVYNYIPPRPDQPQTVQLLSGGTVTIAAQADDPSIKKQIDNSRTISSGKLCSQNIEFLNKANQRVHLVTTNAEHDVQFQRNLVRAGGFKEPGIKPSQIELYALARKSQLQQIGNIVLELLLGHGDTNINVGDIIEFQLPSELAQNNNRNSADPQHFFYSGKYIIAGLTHDIDKETGFTTSMMIHKNGIEKQMPSFDNEVLEELDEYQTTSTQEKEKQLEQANGPF